MPRATGTDRANLEPLLSLPIEGPIVASVDAGVATVTLNRPDKRNALNGEIQALLPRLIATLDDDDAVNVIILTGADPAFCAGVDLKELGAGATGLVLPRTRRGPLPEHRTPIIGAVNGVAVTGGLELALACDFLIASDRARFADTHARVGVMPGWGLSVLLPQAIGVRRARQMSITGNYIDADTACDWGLVNQVVPHDELLPTCTGLARDIVSNDAVAVAQLLDTYHRTADTTVDEAWGIEAEVCRAWAKERLDPANVEKVRADVMARGRSQQT